MPRKLLEGKYFFLSLVKFCLQLFLPYICFKPHPNISCPNTFLPPVIRHPSCHPCGYPHHTSALHGARRLSEQLAASSARRLPSSHLMWCVGAHYLYMQQ